ncbi:nitrous oxide reductase accessory protein NosL [Persephonella sp.]
MNFVKGGSLTLFYLLFLLLVATSCEKIKAPVPINYGVDKCEYCQMKIMDDRYGSELITSTGKVYKFDSIECLASFYIKNKDKMKVHSLWVTDFQKKNLIPAQKAVYLHSKELPSPMGMNLSAFSSESELKIVKDKYGGKVLNWEDVLKLVEEKWLNKGHNHDHGHDHEHEHHMHK